MVTSLLSVLLFIVLTLWALHRLAADRFQKHAKRAVARLVDGPGRPLLPRPVSDLPEPVRRYLDRATGKAPWMPGWMLLDLRARMRFKPGRNWAPQAADLFIGTGEPAFVMMARTAGLPGLALYVNDYFVGGRGRTEARLWGSLPVFIKDKSDLVHVDLYAYLAQIAWAPPALLCNRLLDMAEMEDGGVLLSLEDALVELKFDPSGDLVEVFAPARPRPMSGKVTPTPWRARYTDFTEMGGFRLPRRCQAAWLLEDGPFVYFEGEVTDLAIGPDTR